MTRKGGRKRERLEPLFMVKYNRKVKLDQNTSQPLVLVVSFMDGAVSGAGARETGSEAKRERGIPAPVPWSEKQVVICNRTKPGSSSRFPNVQLFHPGPQRTPVHAEDFRRAVGAADLPPGFVENLENIFPLHVAQGFEFVVHAVADLP